MVAGVLEAPATVERVALEVAVVVFVVITTAGPAIGASGVVLVVEVVVVVDVVVTGSGVVVVVTGGFVGVGVAAGRATVDGCVRSTNTAEPGHVASGPAFS